MKRLVLFALLLLSGAGLYAGGMYLVIKWKQRPASVEKREVTAETLLATFHQACATDPGLRGAYVKSAAIKDGTLTLRGFAGSEEQIGTLQTLARTILDENPKLGAGTVSAGGLNVAQVLDHLPAWQREFEESKGADKDTPEDALKREVMRTTRLDELEFNPEGKLIISGVSIRGNRNPQATTAVLADLLGDRIVAAGVDPEMMPDLALNFEFRQNPATTLQQKLAAMPEAKGIFVVSAHYDHQGKLHFDMILEKAEQSSHVKSALDALQSEPQNIVMLAAPKLEKANVEMRASYVGSDSETRALQKKLAEDASAEKKPLLGKVQLDSVVVLAVVNEKNEPITDDEGNASYVFRTIATFQGTESERKEIEMPLAEWLVEALPRARNPNQTPIPVRLELRVK